MEDNSVEAFREVNLSDGKCNVSLYVCAEEEKKIDEDPEYASKLFKAALEGKLPSASDDADTVPVYTSGNVTGDGEEKDKTKITKIGDWTVTATWILINVLKKHPNLIAPHGNKKIVFTKALTNLAEAGFDFSLQCIELKFNSLMSAYRGLKKSLQNGKGRAKWEYYEAIDSMMNEVEALRLQKKNGEVENNSKSDPEFEDLSSLLEVGITEEDTKANPQKKSVSKSPKISKEQEVASKIDPKKRARISSPSTPSKKQRLITNDKLIKKIAVREEPHEEAENRMKNIQHVVFGNEGFNHTGTLLFIDLIKKHIDLLKKKKSAEMFTLISAEMAKEGYSYTVPKLRKKWYNLLISYRRILERANETGDLVSNWPYYEEIDSIIVDTKALAQSAKGIANHTSSEASTSTATRGKRLFGKNRLLLDDDDEEEEDEEEDEDVTQRRRRREKGASVFDLLRLREASGYTSDPEEDCFQHNLLEDWEQRELRREERDKVKLDILKRIAESVNEMTRKQDEMIDLLKSFK